jgi:hypothetical protein
MNWTELGRFRGLSESIIPAFEWRNLGKEASCQEMQYPDRISNSRHQQNMKQRATLHTATSGVPDFGKNAVCNPLEHNGNYMSQLS